MERLFIDTSDWFAYANRRDPDHERVREVLRAFEGRLVTSSFVFDETVTLCRYRLGRQTAVTVGETLLSPQVTELLQVTSEDEQAAWKLFLDRDDKTYSFTDCTSFVLMRRFGHRKAAAVDDDFVQEGFEVLPA